MEEKKKKSTKKKTTKKVTTGKNKEPKNVTKKVVKETKEPVAKKVTKEEKVEPVIEEPKNEEFLEKTYIFSKDEKDNLEEVITELNKEKIMVEKDVVTRKPANKNIIIVLLVAIVAIVLLCLIYVIKNGLDDDTEPVINSNIIDDASQREMKEESSSFADIEYSNILNTDINKFEVSVAEGKDMLVLISSQTCVFCVTFEPVLNEVLAEKEDTVYRLNISKMNKEETKRLRAYYPFESAPILLVIRKGAVVADIVGAMNKDELNTWYEDNVAKNNN